MSSESLFAAWAARVEAVLDAELPLTGNAPRLDAAMRHAALGGGKRLRPLLVYAAGRSLGADEAALDAPATAVELIHAFSLVHDDLPAMDDDDLRRGRPTVHVAYDVATAILAGDALQATAFGVLARSPLDAGRRVAMVAELAAASGATGMCAGQMLDMQGTGQTLDLARLEALHSLKTGALIRAAVRLGAIAAGAPPEHRRALDAYADAFGLAFQIRDDILDVEGDATQLGKTAGKDVAQGKSTYPALLGLARSRQRLQQLASDMATALEPFGPEADALRALARLSIARLT